MRTKKSHPGIWPLCLLAVPLLAFTACTLSSASRPSPGLPPTPAPVPAPMPPATPLPSTAIPTVTIIAPKDGSTLPAGDITVSVQVTNFTVAPLNQWNVAGLGHIGYLMDATLPISATNTAAGSYVASASTTHTWHNIPPGEHTFAVKLENNDSTFPEVPPTDSVTVHVVTR